MRGFCSIKLVAAVAAVTMLFASSPSARSQVQTPGNQSPPSENQSRIPDNWERAISQLSSPKAKVRIKAFDSIVKMLPAPRLDSSQPPDRAFANSVAQLDPAIADRLKTAIIETLALEQRLHSATQSNAGDVDDEYYRSLVFDVASIDDQRSLPLLVKELSTGEVVGRSVSHFGPKAVGPLISEGDNGEDDERNRSSCPGMLTELLRTRTVTLEANAAEYGLIKAAALHWASAPLSEMRDANVLLLEQINDSDTVDALHRLAATDPEATKGPDGAVHYYVRESAQAALDRLGTMAGRGYFDRPI